MGNAAEIRARARARSGASGNEVEDDTEAVVPEYIGDDAEQAEVERDWLDSVKAFAGGATLDSVGLGEFLAAAGDDEGLLGNTVGAAVRWAGDTERGETLDLYEQGRDEVRKSNPYAHAAGQVTGAVGAGLAANAILPGAGLGGAASVARSAGIGAGMGLMEGAGQSIDEGSVMPALVSAGKGAVMGGAADAGIRGAQQGLKVTRALKNHPAIKKFMSYADDAAPVADDIGTAPTMPPPAPQAPAPTQRMAASEVDDLAAASRRPREVPDLVESSEPYTPGLTKSDFKAQKAAQPKPPRGYRRPTQRTMNEEELARFRAAKARKKDEEFMMINARRKPPPAPDDVAATTEFNPNATQKINPKAASQAAARKRRLYERDFAGTTQRDLLPPPHKPAMPPAPPPRPAMRGGLGHPGAPRDRSFATAGSFEPALSKAARARQALGQGVDQAGSGLKAAGRALSNPRDAARRAGQALGAPFAPPMAKTQTAGNVARQGFNQYARQGGAARHQYSGESGVSLSDEDVLSRMRNELGSPHKEKEAAQPGQRTQSIKQALSDALPEIRQADPEMADLVVAAIRSGSSSSISSVSRQLRAVPGLNWASRDPMRKGVEQ